MCIANGNLALKESSLLELSRISGQPDQRLLLTVLLQKTSARKISCRLHMSRARFNVIRQTGIITPKIARRLNDIQGIELFQANTARKENDRYREWNSNHEFVRDPKYPGYRNMELFCEYFMEWAYGLRTGSGIEK